jgi:hypothetical protein
LFATLPAILGDAMRVEMWFLNIGYAHFGEPPKARDGHFGQNYEFAVFPNSPAQRVIPRTEAHPARDAVNAMQLGVEKQRHQFGDAGSGVFAGSELQTRVKLTAWVRNIAYGKKWHNDFLGWPYVSPSQALGPSV